MPEPKQILRRTPGEQNPGPISSSKISSWIGIIAKVAWRNLARNKRRSFMTILLSGFSAFLLILYSGILNGQYGAMIKSGVEIFPGYIQIAAKGYVEEPGYENQIFNLDETLEAIRGAEGVAAQTVRFQTFVLLSSDTESAGAIVTGIDPSNEPAFSKIDETLAGGKYLSPDDQNVIFIGKEMALNLGVKVGDQISYVSSAVDYSFTADNVTVGGIYRSNVSQFSSSMVFMNKAYMDQMFMTDNIASVIVIQPENIQSIDRVVKNLNQALRSDAVEAMPWSRYMSEMVDMIEVDRIFNILLLGMFVGVIFFVIMIYSLITIYGRFRELGIMRALGTSPAQVISILIFEAMALAAFSIVIGATLGGYLTYYWEIHPIPMDQYKESFEQYSQYGYEFEPQVATLFSLASILKNIILVFFLNLVAVLYPVLKVNRMKPVEAINYV